MPQGKRNEPTVQPSETDKAYAAGFFDGEGCVYVRSQHRPSHEAKGWHVSAYGLVVVSQVDPRPLQWMQARWGGAIRQLKRRSAARPNDRHAWEWNCSARQCYALLHDIRPWLRVKGEQADNVFRLEAMARPMARGWGGHMTEEESRMQEEITAEARRLNQLRPEWLELPEV